MSVFIRGNIVQNSSFNDDAGVFIGQNVQNGWDSASPLKQTAGFSMGDFTVVANYWSGYYGRAWQREGVYDNDIKDNFNRSKTR
jgi:hypothetical protein